MGTGKTSSDQPFKILIVIQYSIIVSPYSANLLKPDQLIIINKCLISNACLEVKKGDWENSWNSDGWRPVEMYAISTETDFEAGDLVWSRAFGVLNYTAGTPKRLVRKVVMRPFEFGKINAQKLTQLLELGESLSLADLQKLKSKSYDISGRV